MKREIQMPAVTNTHWALFGRHVHQDFLVRRLAREGYPKPIAIVAPDETFERDRRLLSEYGLFSQLEALVDDGLVDKVQMESVNTSECIELLSERGCNAAFSTACRNIIKKPLIDYFEGRFFNIHDSFLPNERGGALNSWRILNGINNVGDTIHLIDEGIDTGDIVFQHQVELGNPLPKPLDYDIAQLECAEFILNAFIDVVVRGDPLIPMPQDHSRSLYFPRLYTEINGAIDFSWAAAEVERFVRAFSTPYPGAWTYEKKRRVVIKNVEIVSIDGFHPFCDGRVTTVLENGGIHVIAGGGMLRIDTVEIDGQKGTAAEFLKIMQILRTPNSLLRKARLAVPNSNKMA